jgi:sugar phosphate isomerase/epimerase
MKDTSAETSISRAQFLKLCVGGLTLCAGGLGLVSKAFASLEKPALFYVGCQTYTFRLFSVHEAIAKTAEAGGSAVEFFLGQTLSPTDSAKFGLDLSDDQLSQLKKQLKQYSITPMSCYADIPADTVQATRLFEFAKKLGLRSLSTESVDAIDTIEKLVKEYDIKVGYHGHARDPQNPGYELWNPEFVLNFVKNHDHRIGACADTGHWASSGIMPLDGIRMLAGRIINLHLKDRLEIGHPTTDQIFGHGVSNVAGILTELQRQGFDGGIFVEYESNWENNVPDVRQCIEFVQNHTQPAMPVAK